MIAQALQPSSLPSNPGQHPTTGEGLAMRRLTPSRACKAAYGTHHSCSTPLHNHNNKTGWHIMGTRGSYAIPRC